MSWAARTPIPQPPAMEATYRRESGAAVIGDSIYVTAGNSGGASQSTPISNTWRWDAATDTWTNLADVPSKYSGGQMAALGGKVFSLGGFVGVGGSTGTRNDEYDPGTNIWTPRGSPACNWGSVVAAGNRIYVVGSVVVIFGSFAASASLTYWDTVSLTSGTLAPMPAARGFTASAVIGNYIYTSGGQGPPGLGGPPLTSLYRYDIAANTWTTLAPMLTGRQAHGMAALGGKLYVVGGFTAGAVSDLSLHEYDPATDSWVNMADDLPTPKWYFQAVAGPNGHLFIPCGGDGSNSPGASRTLYEWNGPPEAGGGVDRRSDPPALAPSAL